MATKKGLVKKAPIQDYANVEKEPDWQQLPSEKMMN